MWAGFAWFCVTSGFFPPYTLECAVCCCGQSAVLSFRCLWGKLCHQREMIESLPLLHFHSFSLGVDKLACARRRRLWWYMQMPICAHNQAWFIFLHNLVAKIFGSSFRCEKFLFLRVKTVFSVRPEADMHWRWVALVKTHLTLQGQSHENAKNALPSQKDPGEQPCKRPQLPFFWYLAPCFKKMSNLIYCAMNKQVTTLCSSDI